jgi:peptidoglycan-associated lipoprotein
MVRKSIIFIVLVLCFGLVIFGCSTKKQAVKPSSEQAAASAADKEKARLEAEEKARAEKEREARIKEEEVKKEQARKEQERKELDQSLVAKKTPGIEGEVFESSLLKDIHFDFDKYDVLPGDGDILKNTAALLMKYPSVKIQVEGHCDERGTAEYNLALGERRASSAKKYLVSLGVAEGRISTISYGKEKPVDPGHTEEAWTKNRRDHFIVLSK